MSKIDGCGIWQGKRLGKLVNSVSRVRLFATPWPIAHQAPPSMGFSRQECWSGVPFLSPGDLSNPGIKPWHPALQADTLPSEPPGKNSSILGLPLWLSWWRICLQCRRPGFSPWVGKIPWRRGRLPTPVCWPGEFHGLYSPWGCKAKNRTRLRKTKLKLKKMVAAGFSGRDEI